MPEHYVLNLAALQDYKGFYNEEIAVRRALIFPPICDLCVLGISSENDSKAASAANKLLNIIKENIKSGADFSAEGSGTGQVFIWKNQRKIQIPAYFEV